MPSVSRVRELFAYEPETGMLRYRVAVGVGAGRRNAGDTAGWPNGDGAIRVQVDGEKLLAHKVIWLLVTGELAPLIDHRDLDRSNNRWENLRKATKSQNMANAPKRVTNTVGLKGVGKVKDRPNKFQASITKNRKQRNLGHFDCPAAAHFAYIIAADHAFGEFARAS